MINFPAPHWGSKLGLYLESARKLVIPEIAVILPEGRRLHRLAVASNKAMQFGWKQFLPVLNIYLIATGILATQSTALAHGDAHELIQSVTLLISESPNNAALVLRRAELNFAHGDLQAAEDDYLQVRKLQPEETIVSLGLARIRLAQSREKEALTLLDAFLLHQSNHAGGRTLRAELLEKRGDWQRAEKDLRAAATASTEPQFATLHAQLLERHGRADDAVRALDATSVARGRVPVLEQLALDIQERAGLTQGALNRLDKMINQEPRPDIWIIRKAKLLQKAGRTEEARSAWNQAAVAFEKIPAQKRETKSNQALAKEIESARNKLK